MTSGVTVGKVIVPAGSTFCGPGFLIQPAGVCVLENIYAYTYKSRNTWSFVLVRLLYDNTV